MVIRWVPTTEWLERKYAARMHALVNQDPLAAQTFPIYQYILACNTTTEIRETVKARKSHLQHLKTARCSVGSLSYDEHQCKAVTLELKEIGRIIAKLKESALW